MTIQHVETTNPRKSGGLRGLTWLAPIKPVDSGNLRGLAASRRVQTNSSQTLPPKATHAALGIKMLWACMRIATHKGIFSGWPVKPVRCDPRGREGNDGAELKPNHGLCDRLKTHQPTDAEKGRGDANPEPRKSVTPVGSGSRGTGNTSLRGVISKPLFSVQR